MELQTSNTNILQYWGGIINSEYKCLACVGWNYELRIQMSWETGVELQNLNTNPQYLSINFKQTIIIITWHCHRWSSRVSTSYIKSGIHIIQSDLKIWFIHINTLYHNMSITFANQTKRGIITQNLSHMLIWKCNPPQRFSLILCCPHFSVHVNFRNAIFFNAAASLCISLSNNYNSKTYEH